MVSLDKTGADFMAKPKTSLGSHSALNIQVGVVIKRKGAR